MASAKEYTMLFKLGASQDANFSKTFSNAGTAINGVTGDISGLNAEGEKTASTFEAVGEALIAVGLAAIINKIADAYKECISLSMEFEQAMSQVAATMGVTSNQITELTEYAKEMGATTAFTATEAAEGLNILAMAGLKADEQISALPTVLNLAAAGAMDMASAASYVTGVIKGFGDSMDNANYYADLMAKGATLSNTNVSQLGEALSTAAATAASYGQTADSVTLSLLRLAEQNVTGSEAATKLNRAMANIYTPSAAAEKVFEELGIAIYDSSGNARDLNTIVNELSGALSEYSMEQQNAYKDTIFSQNGLQAFNKMCASSTEKVDEFAAALNNASGSAAQQAETQLDNLAGAITLFNSAADGLKTTIGEAFQSEMTSVVKIASNVISVVNDILKKNPVLLKSLIAITAEIGLLVTAYTAYAAAKKIWTKVSQMETVAKIAETIAQKGLNVAMLECPITWIVAGVAALTVGIIALVEITKQESSEINSLTAASKEEYNALQDKIAEYENAVEVYGENSEEAEYLKWQVEELTESYEANKQTLEEYIAAGDDVRQSVNDTTQSIQDSFAAVQEEETKASALIARLKELASQSTQTASAQGEMEAIIKKLNEMFPALGLTIETVLNGGDFSKFIDNWAQAQFKAKQFEVALDNVTEAYGAQQTAIKQLEQDQDALTRAQNALTAAQDEYDREVGDTILAVFTPQYQALKSAQEEYETLTEKVAEDEAAVAKASNAYQECTDILGDHAGVVDEASSDEEKMQAAISTTTEKVQALVEAYNTSYDAALKSISGQYNIWDEAATVSAVSTDTVTANLDSQTQYWASYNDNLQNLNSRASEIEGLSAVIATFADGSTESVNAIAGMAEATDEELAAMVESYNKLQEQQKTTSDSLADLCTEFSTQMAQLAEDFSTQVEALDLSEEASANGVATMQGFIDGANSMSGSVKAAYTSLGNQAVAALRQAVQSASITATVNVVTSTSNAYATGTDYAARGVALVGEEGPELVYFKGGEQVIPARKTAQMMNGNISVSVAPKITVNGASESTGTIIADTIVAQVISALEEAGIDSRRRAYA